MSSICPYSSTVRLAHMVQGPGGTSGSGQQGAMGEMEEAGYLFCLQGPFRPLCSPPPPTRVTAIIREPPHMAFCSSGGPDIGTLLQAWGLLATEYWTVCCDFAISLCFVHALIFKISFSSSLSNLRRPALSSRKPDCTIIFTLFRFRSSWKVEGGLDVL